MIPHVQELIRRFARDGVLIDTNLLLMLIVGGCDPAEIPRFKRTNRYTTDDFERLRPLLKPVTNFVTTAGVLAAVSNFTGYIREPVRRRAFQELANYISLATERDVPSRVLIQSAEFRHLGLVDASIAEAARASVLVLTDDLRLALHLESFGLAVINYTHVRDVGLWT